VQRPRFVAVGELMVDLVASGRGHDLHARLAPGGSAAIAAAWASVTGAEVRVVGRVGDDFAGRSLLFALEARGIETDVSVDPEAPTGTFLLLGSEVHADRGANARLTPQLLPELLEADAVLVSGYLLAETVSAAAARARAAWTAVTPGTLDHLPADVNAIFANAEEARQHTGLEAAQAAEELGRQFRLACVTLGADGAVAVLDGRTAQGEGSGMEATGLGAGDAFAAGMLVELSRGAELEDALATASRLGALAATSGAWPED
jgi:sugar/nucleoside kinase (ribokinase family)